MGQKQSIKIQSPESSPENRYHTNYFNRENLIKGIGGQEKGKKASVRWHRCSSCRKIKGKWLELVLGKEDFTALRPELLRRWCWAIYWYLKGTMRPVIWMWTKWKAKPPATAQVRSCCWDDTDKNSRHSRRSTSLLPLPVVSLPLVYPIMPEPNWEPLSKGETWFSVLVAASPSRVWKGGFGAERCRCRFAEPVFQIWKIS